MFKLNKFCGKVLYGQDTFQFLLHCDTGYFSIPVQYGCASVSVPYFPPHKTLFLSPLKLSPHITLHLNTSISRLLNLQKFPVKL